MASENVPSEDDDCTLDLTDDGASGIKRKATEIEEKSPYQDDEARGIKRKTTEIEEKSPYENLLSDKGFDYISHKIGERWSSLLIHLDIEHVSIEQYRMDFRFTSERIYQGMYKWNEANESESPETRTGKLFEALRAIEHQNVIDDICKNYAIPVTEETMDTTESDLDRKDAENDSDDLGDLSDVEREVNEEEEEMECEDIKKYIAPPDKEIDMRWYQLELACHATTGNNSIIFAGTGSGKTRIAIYLIKRYLDKNSKAKIIFMANTIPLVSQQFNALKNMLPERYKGKIFKISGEDENSGNIHLILRNELFNVVVITPQILVNHLNENKLLLSELSLLVFDECHHSRKGHPYNRIMKKYRQVQSMNDNSESLPQIVGLTATCSTDKATTTYDALDSLLKLMAAMDVEKLSTVTTCRNEYEKHVVIPETSHIGMQERKYDPVRENIERAMKKVEEKLALSELDTRGKEIRKLLDYIPEDRSDIKYQTWFQGLQNIAHTMMKDYPEDARFALACHAHLKTYFEALELNYILNPYNVASLLLEKIDSQYFISSENTKTEEEKELIDDFKELRKEVKRCVQKKEGNNPNVSKIVEILKEIFQKEGEDSRFIVFVKTRATAVELAEYLKSLKPLPIKCTFLTGHGRSGSENGLDQERQKIVLAQLQRGEIQGIVATSIAEEGIDVPNCNAVIRYNAVGNEISSTQTKGRSRKVGGKSVLIADRKQSIREAVNNERAAMTLEAVEKLLRLPQDNVLGKLKEKKSIIVGEEQLEDQKKEITENLKEEKQFDMICGMCGERALTNAGIRCYKNSHYIVIENDFYKKVIWKEHKAPVKYDDFNKTHKIYGKCCKGDWGIGANIQNTRCAILKLASFLVNGQNYKKWKNVPYHVQSFDEINDVKLLKQLSIE